MTLKDSKSSSRFSGILSIALSFSADLFVILKCCFYSVVVHYIITEKISALLSARDHFIPIQVNKINNTTMVYGTSNSYFATKYLFPHRSSI